MVDEENLSTPEPAMRHHTWQRFEEIAIQAARHLRLTPWEVEFILTLSELGTRRHGATALSDKQLKVLLRVEDRVKVRQIQDWARDHPQRLSAWEDEFLTTLARSQAGISEKQAQVLLRIQDKAMAPTGIGVATRPEQQVEHEGDAGQSDVAEDRAAE